PVFADVSQIEDALLNLSINARDAMPNGGELIVETANAQLDEVYAANNKDVRPGDYVMLSVHDTGTGMPPEVIARATEPFFTTKEQGKGTGLGLSMIYGFAKQSGGHLKIYSEVGFGTTMRLYLPRAKDGATAAAASGDLPAESIPRGRESILLVEDDDDVRAAVLRQLNDLGYRTRIAANGPAALAVLDSGEQFDLLFSDVVMPGGMTGFQLAAEARQRYPGLKVLFATGYAKAPTTAENQPGMTVPVLRKPYRKQDLARKLREVLDGAVAAEETACSAAGLRLRRVPGGG
ncbi:MAG TPA: ATP-binding protein, partial [Candidatus Sulfotelmatobacter sp.]|nr:ATP-binding protein [Candidatus Sulfotelmatobacter sp.]